MRSFLLSLVMIGCFGISPLQAFNGLFGNDGRPTAELVALAETAGIEIVHSDTPATIAEKTKGWSMTSTQRYKDWGNFTPEQRQRVVGSFEKMGLFAARAPSRAQYDYVLLLGNLSPQFLVELRTLKGHVESGKLAFKKIYVLGGNRPIDRDVEQPFSASFVNNSILPYKKGWQKPKHELKTEFDLIKWLYNTVELPDSMRNNVEFISATATGQASRGDTIREWQQQANPAKGSTILAVSFPPSTVFDELAIKEALGTNFAIDMVNCSLEEMVDPQFHPITPEIRLNYVPYLLDRVHDMINVMSQRQNRTSKG